MENEFQRWSNKGSSRRNTKLKSQQCITLTFNNVDVGQIRSQKHLGVFLDVKLGFNKHLEKV